MFLGMASTSNGRAVQHIVYLQTALQLAALLIVLYLVVRPIHTFGTSELHATWTLFFFIFVPAKCVQQRSKGVGHTDIGFPTKKKNVVHF